MEEARYHCFRDDLHSLHRRLLCGQAVLGDLVCKIHSREEHNLTGPVELPNQVLPTKWLLLPQVYDAICKVFECPHVDLFATRANAKFPLQVCQFADLLVWKQGAFQHPWNNPSAYTFPPFTLLRLIKFDLKRCFFFFFFFFFFYMNGNTERAQCALSRVCIL